MLEKRIEYRVLPGLVLLHPAYLSMMLSLYRTALYLTLEGEAPPPDLVEVAREAINTADKAKAKAVWLALPKSEYTHRILAFYQRHPLEVLSPFKWRTNIGFKRYYRNPQLRG